MNAPSAEDLPGGRWTAGIALALFAAGVALYARAGLYDFVNWDDDVYVLRNAAIRSFSFESLRQIFTQPVLGGILPVHLLSYSIDHSLWGLRPQGYHWTSLLLNAANGALAWLLLRRLCRTPAVAVVAALLFCVHHSHVSSVVWISARKELLYTFFLLLSTLAYLRARRGTALDARAYALSLALFALGSFSKVTISTYPLFLLLVDRVFARRLSPQARRPLAHDLATKLPFLLLAALAVAVNAWAQVPSELPWASDPLNHALVKGHAAWRYMWVLFGVLAGQPIYDLPRLSLHPVAVIATFAPIFAVALAFAWAWWRGRDEVALAIGWTVAGLLPPMLFPLMTFMADRYLYAPSLGFCWLLALAIVGVARWRGPTPRRELATTALLGGLAAFHFASITWNYTPVWRNSESLWSYANVHSRDGRVAVSLSDAMLERGAAAEAVAVLEKTEVPGLKGYINLAKGHLALGQHRDALRATDRALAELPRDSEAPESFVLSHLHHARGAAFWGLGRQAEAAEAWRAALRADPSNHAARRRLERVER